jgi:hypothetical protein
MGPVVYGLCALAAIACAGLLLRAYLRNRTPLLLWSGLCFVGLTLNNLLVFVDLVVAPGADFFLWRNVTGLVAMSLLVGGLVWNSR